MTAPDCRIPDADGSSYPYWIIIDPSGIAGRLRTRDSAVSAIAFAVTGPFFSRATAQAALDSAPHRYGAGSVVWCGSGHGSRDWRGLCAEPAGMADRLAAAEAEVARLHRQNAQLTEEVHDLPARLQEAHDDADRLAVAVLVASGDMDAAEALGPHPTAEQVDVALNNAAARILNEWGPWRPVAGGAR